MAKKTPVTMLSGFLGAGKTCLLRYVLENSNEKMACIVNDVASVNIDAKLVRNDRNRSKEPGTNTTTDLADTIELANGCACCNLQDELFASFEQILSLADKRGEPYTRIILENSGVAEPQNIRDQMNEAEAKGHPVMQRIELDTLVTVVDCSDFLKNYATKTPLVARPELGDGGSMRPVVDLLVEQVECADFIILNKTDLLDGGKLEQLKSIVATLNPFAAVVTSEYGKIPISTVFGSEAHARMSKFNIEAQHRGAVAAAKAANAQEHHHHKDGEHSHKDGHAHKHDHKEHGHDHTGDDSCDHTHDHDGHAHKHDHKEHGHDHTGDDSCDHTHGHDGHAHKHEHKEHGHDHTGDDSCDHTHDHEHKHEHKHSDHSHDHSHKHGHSHSKQTHETTAAMRFGIRSFVYSRRRPFHPMRLKNLVLKWLPVTYNKALEGEAPGEGIHPLQTVIRSKGFFWMSNSHAIAYYWSHAGAHFEIREEGDWWAAIPEDEWPQEAEQRAVVMSDYDASSKYGDRRQEIVFIGASMDEDKIVEQLDKSLLTDEEMVKYDARWEAPAATTPAAP